MPITENSSLEDVCFAVCTALQNAGTIVVLRANRRISRNFMKLCIRRSLAKRAFEAIRL